MNDSTSRPSGRSAEDHAGLPSGTLQTSTLQALRELLDVAGRVGPTVARRASLTHTELQTLELIFDTPMGPADLAVAWESAPPPRRASSTG